MTRFRIWAAAALILWAGPALAQNKPVVVFAAASLKNALDDIDAAHAGASGTRATISYAASSALAKQIEAGAPADLFISADLAWMDYLAARHLIRPESRVDLLSNSLVLIAPADSTAAATIAPSFPLARLLGGGRLAMADAAVDRGVKVIAVFPADAVPPIVYPMALTAASANPAAGEFAAYLRGPAARTLFEKQGFTVLPAAAK